MLKQLKIYYLLVSLPFVLLLVGAAIFSDGIKSTIIRNPHPQINFTIFFIILVGGVIILLNSRRLIREAKALVEFSRALHSKIDPATLQKMASSYSCDIASLLQMVASSGNRSISHQEQAAIEHELSNVHSRLYRRNALPQYLTGLLVGMGLLGTFIGLLATLADISDLIGSFAGLDMATADPIVVFRNMIERMKAPMQSMGIAFSASMFGLLGSIILGLMMVGIRRLQGDIYSLLSTEIAQHIEVALLHESLSFENGGLHSGDAFKVLVRIEKRIAEASRLHQQSLAAEKDDFQKQRADMLNVLTAQTEASNNFCRELQQLGKQLGTVTKVMQKSSGEVLEQISELKVHVAGDAKEMHKLLSLQVDGQKTMNNTLDSFKIDEKLSEVANLQKQSLSVVTEDLQKQRSEMLRTLTAQTEASDGSRGDLQKLGGQLSSVAKALEQGSGAVMKQVSELSSNLTDDVKESRKLLASQLDGQNWLKKTLESYKIEERLSEATRLHQRTLVAEKDELQKQRADLVQTLTEQGEASRGFHSELQLLGKQLEAVASIMERGNGEITSQVSELMIHIGADAEKTHKLLMMLGKTLTAQKNTQVTVKKESSSA